MPTSRFTQSRFVASPLLNSQSSQFGEDVVVVSAVESGALSSQATLDITLGSADMYEIDMMNVVPATDAAGLQIRFSQSATFLEGVADYGWGGSFNTNGVADASDSEIQMGTSGVGSGTAEGVTATFRIFRPAASSFYKALTWNGFGYNAATNQYMKLDGGGTMIANTNAIDGVRFFFSGSSDIASGFYAVRSYSFT